MSTKLPLETVMTLQRMVRKICMETLGFTAGQYALAIEFAQRYLMAMKEGDKGLMKDIEEAYINFGTDPEVVEKIKKFLHDRYGKKETGG